MDATDLYLAAERVDGCATELRARADLVRLRVQMTRWHSTAAAAAFDRVDELITLLINSADHVAAVAEATRLLAAKVASS